MNFLDMKTVIFSHIITDLVCLVVMVALWRHNRHRFAGLGYWVADYAMQVAAMVLIILRGAIPDLLSMVGGTSLAIGGLLAMLMGLQRLFDRKTTQVHNYLVLAVFIAVQAYFSVVQPNLAARNLNLSLTILVVTLQCAWLMRRGVDSNLRALTRGPGLVFAAYGAVSAIRVVAILVGPISDQSFFASGAVDTLILLTYQMLFIIQTYTLVLLINRLLMRDVQEAKDQLAAKEHYFRTLIYSIHEDILVIDRNYRITDINNTALLTLGKPREAVVGRLCHDVSHGYHTPCHEQGERCPLREVFDTGRACSCRHPHFRQDGSRAHIDVLMSPLKDAAGRVTHVVEAARDITDLVAALEAKHQSEQRHKVTLMSVGDAVITTDPAGRVEVLNPVAEALTGWSREEAGGRPLDEIFCIVNEHTRRPVQNPVELVLRQGQVVGLANHTLLIAKDGTERPIADSGAPIRTEDGQIAGVVLVFRDQTEARKAREALEKAAGDWQATFDAAQSAIWILDKDQKVVQSNRAADRLFGKPGLNSIGRRCWEIAHGTDDALPECPIRRARNSLVRETMDIQIGSRWYEVTADPILDQAGQFNGAVHVVTDITERKLLEAKLMQAHKMESVGRLAGGVAHDFNNKLTVIKGNAELALAEVAPGSGLHESLEEILTASVYATELTRQLLAFARKQIISPVVMALNEALAGMLKMLQRLIGEDIELVWKPGRDLWPVEIDPAQLDQILANLAVNARDAISGVGTLTIETDTVVFDPSYCQVHAGFVPGRYVMLAVTDTGSGMDRDTLEHIFEPFFTTKDVGRGTGLGLATVYGIVKQNNGFINVYSEPGQGTSCKIYLPPATDGIAAAVAPAEQQAAGGTETVLIVEDEKPLLKLATAILEKQGYTVLGADRPALALALARQHQGAIDLLITDVVMPEMNGRRVMEQVMAIYPRIKSLFMSGYTANVIAHRGFLDEGANYLQKPFTINGLAVKVRQVLDGG